MLKRRSISAVQSGWLQKGIRVPASEGILPAVIVDDWERNGHRTIYRRGCIAPQCPDGAINGTHSSPGLRQAAQDHYVHRCEVICAARFSRYISRADRGRVPHFKISPLSLLSVQGRHLIRCHGFSCAKSCEISERARTDKTLRGRNRPSSG